jgi:hypothetical protein
MTREPDPLQPNLARLQRQDRRVPATPTEAQADFDAAGELPLSGEDTEAIVRYMMQPDHPQRATPHAPESEFMPVALHQVRLATARRQTRIWQAVAGALAACLVAVACLWFASDRGLRVIYVQKSVPAETMLVPVRLDEPERGTEPRGANRARMLTDYFNLQQQVFARGVDALPAGNVYVAPSPPVTMESLLRTSS